MTPLRWCALVWSVSLLVLVLVLLALLAGGMRHDAQHLLARVGPFMALGGFGLIFAIMVKAS